MFGLTPFGTLHTAFSVIALAAGFICLFLDHEISPRAVSGRLYIWATVIVCLTGFGIFQHGSVGKPHALALMTLLVLGVAGLAGAGRLFGRAAPYVEVVSYSLTYFLHLVPGLTETFTRLPVDAPYFDSAEDPALQNVIGMFFMLFLIVAISQVRRLRLELRDGRGLQGLA